MKINNKIDYPKSYGEGTQSGHIITVSNGSAEYKLLDELEGKEWQDYLDYLASWGWTAEYDNVDDVFRIKGSMANESKKGKMKGAKRRKVLEGTYNYDLTYTNVNGNTYTISIQGTSAQLLSDPTSAYNNFIKDVEAGRIKADLTKDIKIVEIDESRRNRLTKLKEELFMPPLSSLTDI